MKLGRTVFFLFLGAASFAAPARADFCADDFSSVARPKTLTDLTAYLESQKPGELLPHRLTFQGGRAVLHIGFLRRSDSTFLRLLVRAILQGGLQEIQVGEVVGPKALSFLQQLRELKITGEHQIKMTGEVVPEGLIRAFRAESTATGQALTDPRHWTEKDAADFQASLAKFGVGQACQALRQAAPEACGRLYFETMLSARPSKMKWRR